MRDHDAASQQAPCGCRPGSAATGWREVRSAQCQAMEEQAWAKAHELAMDAVRPSQGQQES